MAALPAPRDFGAPAAAYRLDAGENGAEFGAHDAAWLTAATLVEHAGLPEHPEREALLRDAIEIAQDLVGDDTLRIVGGREWGDRERFDAEILILLSRRMRERGARRLASALLDAMLRASGSLTPVQRGRIMVERARTARERGELDEALERYRALETMGRSSQSAELRVLAWNGIAAIAQARGNYPEMQRYARRAARLADREGFTAMSRTAHYALMFTAGVARRFDEAMIEGWNVYQLSLGDPAMESSALQSLGQLLLESGRHRAAEAVFATICARRLPLRTLLPALSGLAVASAACAHEATVEWSVAEIRSMRPMVAARYDIADALAECAVALTILGREDDAARCREDARGLADRYGLHEIAFRLERTDEAARARRSTVQQSPLPARASAVVQDLEALMPEALPKHVQVAMVEP